MFPIFRRSANAVVRLSAASVIAVTAGLLALTSAGCAADEANQPAPGPSVYKPLAVTTILWVEGEKNAYPRWSRDGSRILFQSDRSGTWQIYVMDGDGSNRERLTSGDCNNKYHSWSPDNSAIAFVSDCDGNEDIFVMDSSGGNLRNLSNHPARDIHPYWSQDGQKILFNSDRNEDLLQIYEISIDGTGLRHLVDSSDHNTCARVSPNGDRIVYLANLAIGQDDIFVASRDGTSAVNITDDEVADGWPIWTPNSRRIVYASRQNGAFSLYSMRPDGSDRRRITFPEPGLADARPDISADGRRMVFNRQNDSTIGIFAVDLRESSESTGATRHK
jgi:Tol biopolymer transport system component